MKLKSDKGFREFLKGSKNGLAIAVLLLAGFLFILIGSFGSTKTAEVEVASEEERLSEICSMINGVGRCRVMINYGDEKNEQVAAVLILCQGAESVSVRRDLTEAVCSLYGIGANRVEIFSLSEEYAEK